MSVVSQNICESVSASTQFNSASKRIQKNHRNFKHIFIYEDRVHQSIPLSVSSFHPYKMQDVVYHIVHYRDISKLGSNHEVETYIKHTRQPYSASHINTHTGIWHSTFFPILTTWLIEYFHVLLRTHCITGYRDNTSDDIKVIIWPKFWVTLI